MSNLLSGLEDLVLGSVSKLDVYGDIEPVRKKAPVVEEEEKHEVTDYPE